MEQNPYQPPTTQTHIPSDILSDIPSEAIGVPSGKREDLLLIAVCQKGVLVCVMIFIIGFFATVAFSYVRGIYQIPLEVSLLLLWILPLAAILGMLFYVPLTMKTCGWREGLPLVVLSLFPCLSPFMILAVNSMASDILKKNGIKVGFFGANLSRMRVQGPNIPNDPA